MQVYKLLYIVKITLAMEKNKTKACQQCITLKPGHRRMKQDKGTQIQASSDLRAKMMFVEHWEVLLIRPPVLIREAFIHRSTENKTILFVLIPKAR